MPLSLAYRCFEEAAAQSLTTIASSSHRIAVKEGNAERKQQLEAQRKELEAKLDVITAHADVYARGELPFRASLLGCPWLFPGLATQLWLSFPFPPFFLPLTPP
jgi:hypothetical protein